MKIKVVDYRTFLSPRYKNDIKLIIGLSITTNNETEVRTSACIQLWPISYFHGKIDEEAYGLLFLSAIVYAIDRAIDRHKYSIDGWTREFDVDILIPAHVKFRLLENEINKMLSFLTGDYWNCHFIGDIQINYPRYKPNSYFDDINQVNLFSGGMDSLIGAIDYLAGNPNGILYLSSHYDSFMRGPKNDQSKVLSILSGKYKDRIKSIGATLISPGNSVEMSCRSRSLMFLALAVIVAEYASCDIVVPENGSVSLNYPLSPSRRGACSTRTTHPLLIRYFQNLIYRLELKTKVYNPYEFFTKGEMVQSCVDKEFLIKVIPYSNSCGKRSMHQQMYDNRNASHCAHCMPCMYRKAALTGETDLTTYGNRLETIFNMKNGSVSNDFFAMLDFLKLDLTPDEIRHELYIGGMVDFDNIEEYVNLVLRTRIELQNMLRYENSSLINQYMGWI